MASVLNSVGLTLRNIGFVKFNALFPVLVAGAHFSLRAFVDAGLTDEIVARTGVSSKKFPFFVLALLPVIAILCAIVAILGLTIYGKNGYESHQSRAQKEPTNLKRSGVPLWIARVQGAQYNTWETCIFFMCTLYAAQNTGVSDKLITNTSAFVLAMRVVYPFFYAFDLDLFRTMTWYFALQAMVMIGFAGCFPNQILPLLK